MENVRSLFNLKSIDSVAFLLKRKNGESEEMNTQYEHITHPFDPVFDKDSEILILGSLPSVKSREHEFYYGHPQNRFWRVLAAVYGETMPQTKEEKRAFLLRNHLALWDVIASCDIVGSSDSSIRNAVPNDLSVILDDSAVRKICLNGSKAYELFCRYCKLSDAQQSTCEIVRLPSTSPANAAWSPERLVGEWREGMLRT